MSEVQTVQAERSFTVRLFAAAPVPPMLVGGLLATALIGALLAIAWLSGDLAGLSAEAEPWWRNRDARLALVVSLLAAALVTAIRYHAVGTREDLASVARLGGWRIADVDPTRAPGDAFRERRAGLIGALIVPLFALLVDRDPMVYFQPGYWYASKAWTWLLGMLTTWGGGVLTYRAIRDARAFSRLAAGLPEVDLLEPGRLVCFTRQGIRATLPGLLGVSFLALNALDRDFLWAIGVMGGLSVGGAAAVLAIPLHGLRLRVRAAKQEELARVHAAIRGEPGALTGSAIERRESPSLSDLLAYRAQVASVPEWPLDVPSLGRFAVVVAIPVASWVGGALVERALDLALR